MSSSVHFSFCRRGLILPLPQGHLRFTFSPCRHSYFAKATKDKTADKWADQAEFDSGSPHAPSGHRPKDGTAEAVVAEFPTTKILIGNGSLYWCGGMRKAWREAAASDPDHYFLLNDDTLLLPEALRALLETSGTPESRIIAVAAIRDPETGEASYGGIRGKSGMLPPTGRPEVCDTLNANAVLVPRKVYSELGVFHDAYTHGMGDFDYGFTATRSGIKIVQSANFLGECKRNPISGSWRDRSLPRVERWKQLHGPKGLPLREWMEFNRRNAGWIWPIRTLTPSIRVLLGL